MKGKKQQNNKVPFNYLLILCVAFLIVCLYLKTNVTYMKFLYVCLFAIGISELHVNYLKSKILVKIKDTSPVRINKKEGTEISLLLSNTSFIQSPYIYIFLKPTFHVKCKQYKGLCVTLPPFSQKEIKIEFEGKYSGKEFIEIGEIVIQDFFELVKRKIHSDERREVVVLPQVEAIDELQYLLNNLEAKTTKQETLPLLEEEGEVSYDLRQYREGDSLRLVHWKMVARRGVYLVRQREKKSSITDEYIVVVDPLNLEQDGNRRAEQIDRMLVAAISCISTLLKLENKVTLIYQAQGRWEEMSLIGVVNIGELAKALGENSSVIGEQTKNRWPGEYIKQLGKSEVSKLLISSRIDSSLLDEIEREKDINLLAMSRGVVHEKYFGDAWYLTDEFEVVRNV